MTLQPFKFGLAAGLTSGLLWILCSLLVYLLPAFMMAISGHMIHMEIATLGWHLTLAGVFWGLVGWFVSALLFGWLLAAIYNSLR
ncbi:DUF5676 family membrane protein [Porticoccus sp.]